MDQQSSKIQYPFFSQYAQTPISFMVNIYPLWSLLYILSIWSIRVHGQYAVSVMTITHIDHMVNTRHGQYAFMVNMRINTRTHSCTSIPWVRVRVYVIHVRAWPVYSSSDTDTMRECVNKCTISGVNLSRFCQKNRAGLERGTSFPPNMFWYTYV